MEKKKNYTVGTTLQSNTKIIERAKIVTPTHKFMITHFTGLVHLNTKWWSFYGPKPPRLLKCCEYMLLRKYLLL